MAKTSMKVRQFFVKCFVIDGHAVDVFLRSKADGQGHGADTRFDLRNQIRSGIDNNSRFQ